jgi:hypothetical protein
MNTRASHTNFVISSNLDSKRAMSGLQEGRTTELAQTL